MSKWVEGKIELSCSLEVLRRALISVYPEWEKYILVDTNGNIDLYRYNGQKLEGRKYHLVIPGSGRPGLGTPPNRNADNDWGFELLSGDAKMGKWRLMRAEYGKERADKLEQSVISEIGAMKTKLLNKQRGYREVSDKILGDVRTIDAVVPIDSLPYDVTPVSHGQLA